MNLGENIYHYRSQKNMSQGDLADALEVSRQSVSKWENNSAVPELEKLMRMAQIFEITIDELVTGEETGQPAPPPPAAPAMAEPAPAKPAGPFPTRILVGAILLGGGLLAFIILLAIGLFVDAYGWAFLIGLPLIVIGVCCLLIKKHVLLICSWILYIPLWIIAFLLMMRSVTATIGGFFQILMIVLGAALSAITLIKLWTGKIQTPLAVRVLLTALIGLLILVSVFGMLPPKSGGVLEEYSSTLIEPD